MTTRKPYHGKDGPVIFGRPTIGPRVYLVRGPSGWSETFNRKLADVALVKFITPLDIGELVSAFLTAMQLERLERPRAVVDWDDVTSYIAKITKQPVKAIPEIVVVAFWAQVILHEDQEETN